MKAVQVFKFGGASVRDPQAIRNVAGIVNRYTDQPLVIVISAMGKMTNHLEKIIHAHYHDPALLPSLVDEVKRFHHDIATELMGDAAAACLHDLHDLWVTMQWILEEDPHPNFNYHYDQIICFGELASTKVVSHYFQHVAIRHQWHDAREILRTDDAYREARIQWEETQENVNHTILPALHQDRIIITQGFIGSTRYNESTSLGREGSDYTAAILAYTLDATAVTIWKDVPGIMTGDPKRFDNVVLLPEISYLEAIEMTYYGAKVIHPKTLKPLQNKNIPLYVRPFDQPDQDGTRIAEVTVSHLPPVVVAESNQALLRISTRDFSFVAEEHLGEIFSKMASLRIKVNSMRNTALSFMVCITMDKEKMLALESSLADKYITIRIDDLELITVRHATDEFVASLKDGKEILFEEQYGRTDQFICK